MKTTHNTSVGPRPRWLVVVPRIHGGRGERVVSTPTCSRQSYRAVTTGLETGVHQGESVTSNWQRFAPGGLELNPDGHAARKNTLVGQIRLPAGSGTRSTTAV